MGLALITIVAILIAVTPLQQQLLQPANAWIFIEGRTTTKAPPAITGDNVYVVWWTDKETPHSNGEVIFRA